MFMGAISGLAGSYFYEQAVLSSGGTPSGVISAVIALITSMLAGMLGALIYSFLTISLRANQNVTGLTLTIFGTGFGNFFGEYIGQKAGGYVAVSSVTKAAFSGLRIPVLSDLPVLGSLLFSYNWLVYLAVLLAVLMSWFFARSRVGLNLRAVGEDPATADAVGINVTLYKYAATVIGGGICGIGGMYMSMVTTSGVWAAWLCQRLWLAGSGTGYLCHLAPFRGMIVALIFGGLTIMRMYVSIPGLPAQIYDMLPYAATILVLVVTSMRSSREHAQPKSCGLNYFREERITAQFHGNPLRPYAGGDFLRPDGNELEIYGKNSNDF